MAGSVVYYRQAKRAIKNKEEMKMYTVTKFVLDNGQEFNTEKEARKALDNLYGDALERLVHGLCRCNGRYSEMLKYLDNNIIMMQDIVEFYQELKSKIDE